MLACVNKAGADGACAPKQGALRLVATVAVEYTQAGSLCFNGDADATDASMSEEHEIDCAEHA